jgi:hypothetical protein
VWTLRWREKLPPCRESKPTPTAITVSVLFVSRSFLYTLSYSAEIWSVQIWTLFKSLKPQKIGNAYLFSASRFPKEHYFFKVVSLCPFVLITAVCKWSWAWSTGGTILKGENPSTQWNSVPMPLFPPKISHGIAQDRTWDWGIRCRWLTAIARPKAWS